MTWTTHESLQQPDTPTILSSLQHGSSPDGYVRNCFKCKGLGWRRIKPSYHKLLREPTSLVPPPQAMLCPDDSNPTNPWVRCFLCHGAGLLMPVHSNDSPPPPPKSPIRPFKWPQGHVIPGPARPSSSSIPSHILHHPRPGELLTSLCGHWYIYQLESGHRYTTDDVCTAAITIHYMTMQSEIPVTTYLDIGTGLGSVLMMCSWHFLERGLQKALGIEAQAAHVDLARRSIAFNGVQDKLAIRHADLRYYECQEGSTFDLITGTPPYFIPANYGTLPVVAGRGMCSFELRGGIEVYCEAAAKHLARKPSARFIFTQTSREIKRSEKAAQASGFQVLERWDVFGIEGRPEPLFSTFICGWSDALNDDPSSISEYPVHVHCVRVKGGDFSPRQRELMVLVGKPPV